MTPSADIRMQAILRRTRQLRRRLEFRTNCILSTVCLFLTGSIVGLLHQNHAPGISTVTTGYSSVLLHSGTDVYVVIGIGSFVTGVVFTLICIRYQRRKSLRRRTSPDATGKDSTPESLRH